MFIFRFNGTRNYSIKFIIDTLEYTDGRKIYLLKNNGRVKVFTSYMHIVDYIDYFIICCRYNKQFSFLECKSKNKEFPTMKIYKNQLLSIPIDKILYHTILL